MIYAKTGRKIFQEEMSNQIQLIGDEFHMIPIYAPKFSAGPGEEIIYEKVIGRFPIPMDEIETAESKPQNLISFRVKNDSMEDMIKEESLIVIDVTQKDIIDNKQYAFLINDDYLARVKTLRKAIDGLILHSENPKYIDEKIPNNSGIKFTMIGRVVWVGSKL